ncbi:PorV/PorQ family protein [Telluribacter humicola]|uniref:hypothetical protein n=1 Tax=Telluribacter humicola TaxID=1720261 RepID=UPI001A95D99E|nr:hypothetical protein [Telluribacter humicola]
MANAVVAQSDRYSVVNNIAGLAGVRDASLFSSYHTYYGFDGIGTIAFGAVMPISRDLTTGLSVQRFGDKLYNELAFGIGAGHRINRISLGLKISYVQIAVNAPSLALSRKALLVEMGGIMQLTSKLDFGVHMYNVVQGSFTGESSEQLPTVLRAGLAYKPISALRLSGELVKDTALPTSFRAGLEYEIVSSLFVRTGIATKPNTNHFGLGYAANGFNIDYAVHTHPQLGWSHHVTVAYSFAPKSEAE